MLTLRLRDDNGVFIRDVKTTDRSLCFVLDYHGILDCDVYEHGNFIGCYARESLNEPAYFCPVEC